MDLMWMIAGVLIVLSSMAVAALALKAAKRLKQRLEELQAQDELLSRRCDELTERLETLSVTRRLDHLSDLVRAGAQSGRLDDSVAQSLESYLEELRQDAPKKEA